MNQELTDVKHTIPQSFVGALIWFGFSTSAESKSDQHVMLSNTLKTLKERFLFGEGSGTQGKPENDGSESCHTFSHGQTPGNFLL